MVEITKHAQQRMKERVGIKSFEKMIRLAEKALEKGLSYDNTDCKLALNQLKEADKSCYPNRTLRMLGEQIFVFVEEKLITVLPIDPIFKKRMEKIRFKEKKMNLAHAA